MCLSSTYHCFKIISFPLLSFLKHDLSLTRGVMIDGEGLGSEIRGDLLISSLPCRFNFQTIRRHYFPGQEMSASKTSFSLAA